MSRVGLRLYLVRKYHPGRNSFKIFPWNIYFVIIFVNIVIPPKDFLCNVAATGVSLFPREHAKDLACKVIVLSYSQT